jgi:hypothetical protein
VSREVEKALVFPDHRDIPHPQRFLPLHHPHIEQPQC